MTTTAEVQAHPALIGETTELFIALLREYRTSKAGTIAHSYWSDMLAGAVDQGIEGDPGAEITEARAWLQRAAAGEPEAKALVDSIPPWYENRDHDYLDAINHHALPLWAKGFEPDAAPPKAGKAEGLERIEQHADKLPKASRKVWAPNVKKGSGPALAWDCLAELSPDGEPVDLEKWQEETVRAYFSAADTLADRQAAFRVAKARLKSQGAFKEDKAGAIRRKV